MAAIKEPRGGIWYGWSAGEDNWNTEMNDNLKRLGSIIQLYVEDRNLSTPPGSPSDGDGYIVGATPTGGWSGHEDHIAIWDSPTAAWVFITPKIGWTCFIVDEEVLSAYLAAGWTTGILLTP